MQASSSSLRNIVIDEWIACMHLWSWLTRQTQLHREGQRFATWNSEGNQMSCISEATNHLQIKFIYSNFPETIKAYLLVNWSPSSSILDIPCFVHHFQKILLGLWLLLTVTVFRLELPWESRLLLSFGRPLDCHRTQQNHASYQTTLVEW